MARPTVEKLQRVADRIEEKIAFLQSLKGKVNQLLETLRDYPLIDNAAIAERKNIMETLIASDPELDQILRN